MSNTNYRLPVGTETRWKSFFKDNEATDKILFSTWLISMTCGGLHLVSVGFDLYLVLIFRAITRLPPDMNPLEDNLTSRTKRNRTKHKSKTSSLSGMTFAEKRSCDTADSKEDDLSDSERFGRAQPPHIPESLLPDSRPLSFFHSRQGSDPTFSAHTPNSARLSRSQFKEAGVYQHVGSNRNSRVDGYGKTSIRRSVAQSRRSVFIEHNGTPNKRDSMRSSPYAEDVDGLAEPEDTLTRQKSHLTNDNWFVHESDARSDYDPYGEAYNTLNGLTPTRRGNQNSYAKVPQYPLEDEVPQPKPTAQAQTQPEQTKPEPLRMNPPTPPAPQNTEASATAAFSRDRDYTSASVESATSIYSRPVDDPAPQPPAPPKHSPPKRRFYGDLAAATRGVREKSQSPRPAYAQTHNVQVDQHGGVVRNGPDRSGQIERSPRVVSRTGIDLDDARSMFPGIENTRGRDVSGKIAEEGRGGAWGMRSRKVSGVA